MSTRKSVYQRAVEAQWPDPLSPFRQLSPRAARVLLYAGLVTPEAILSTDAKAFERLPNFGPVSLKEVRRLFFDHQAEASRDRKRERIEVRQLDDNRRPACGDCRYWEPGVHQTGACHRHAPKSLSYHDEDVRKALAIIVRFASLEAGNSNETADEDYCEIHPEDRRTDTCWPVTEDHGWCGDFDRILDRQGK
jgi:hypothetical protein